MENLLTASKRLHNFISSCYSLLFLIIVLRHLDTRSASPSHSLNFKSVMVLCLGSGYISSVSSSIQKGALLPSFNSVVKRVILFTVFQYHEYIDSIVKDLRAFLGDKQRNKLGDDRIAVSYACKYLF
jgi:hypothetical protein